MIEATSGQAKAAPDGEYVSANMVLENAGIATAHLVVELNPNRLRWQAEAKRTGKRSVPRQHPRLPVYLPTDRLIAGLQFRFIARDASCARSFGIAGPRAVDRAPGQR